MDFGDGGVTSSSEGLAISSLRNLRLSFDPKGESSIVPVYRYITKAWNLLWRQLGVEETTRPNSRHKRHVRYFDHLSIFNALVVAFTKNLIVFEYFERAAT